MILSRVFFQYPLTHCNMRPTQKSQCTGMPLRLVRYSQRLLSHRWPGVGRTPAQAKRAERVPASKAFEANPLGAKWMTVRRWATCAHWTPSAMQSLLGVLAGEADNSCSGSVSRLGESAAISPEGEEWRRCLWRRVLVV